MYVHFIIDVERIDVVGIGLSEVFLTPQMLGLSMNPNMEPVNIQRSFTLTCYCAHGNILVRKLTYFKVKVKVRKEV